MNKNTSRHLIDEYPIMFHKTLAVALGLNEAILLQKIHMWMQCKPPEAGGDRSFIYNSYRTWHEQLPFISESTIKRALTNLVKQGILIKANFNKEPVYRTNWYSIDYDKLDIIVNQKTQNHIDLALGQNDPIHEVKMTQSLGQNDPNNNNIYNNIYNNINNNILSDNIEQKNISKTSEYENEFNELWKLYPRKEGKNVALKKYIQYRKNNEATFDEVKRGIINYKKTIDVNKTSTQYILHGSTFFNQKRWEDEELRDKPNNLVKEEISQERLDVMNRLLE